MSLYLTAAALVIFYGVITPADGTTKLLNAFAFANGWPQIYLDWPSPWTLF